MSPGEWVLQIRERRLDLPAFAQHLDELRRRGVRDGVWVDEHLRACVLLYGRAMSAPRRLPPAERLPIYASLMSRPMPRSAKRVLRSLQAHDPLGRMPAWMLFSGSARRSEVEAYIWLWVCYTLADHLVDGELGVEVLPAVLWAQRLIWRCLSHLPDDVKTYLEAHLASFEASLGESDPYAPWKRSSAVAALVAVTSSDREVTYASLLPVLAARQLLDDLHDWRDDLAHSVATLPVHLHGPGDPDPRRYWAEVVPPVCDAIETACTAMPTFFAYEAAAYRDAVWRAQATYALGRMLQGAQAL